MAHFGLMGTSLDELEKLEGTMGNGDNAEPNKNYDSNGGKLSYNPREFEHDEPAIISEKKSQGRTDSLRYDTKQIQQLQQHLYDYQQQNKILENKLIHVTDKLKKTGDELKKTKSRRRKNRNVNTGTCNDNIENMTTTGATQELELEQETCDEMDAQLRDIIMNFIVILLLYIILSQPQVIGFFGTYIKILNPENNEGYNFMGVLVYGLILATLFSLYQYAKPYAIRYYKNSI